MKLKSPAPDKARLDISVGKYRWISYNGKRLTYDFILQHFGSREKMMQFMREHTRSKVSWAPPGFWGGNIPTVQQMTEPLRLLALAGLNPQLLKKNIRFFVTICGSAAPDKNPDPRTHVIDYSKHNGFETRAEADAAARSRFAYYDHWCREGRKRTNVVTLKLYDKEGNLTHENHN